jgi:hypothetical protein
MTEKEPHPTAESLEKLADFARRVISVPKAEVDKKLREARKHRRTRKRRLTP